MDTTEPDTKVLDIDTSELVQQAKALSREQRKEILMSIPERDLHFDLKELFEAMEHDYTVEVTQGPKELGKDLVLVKQDNITIDVIGVVVKCGNVKGKTLGEVEEVRDRIEAALSVGGDRKTKEIESQIRQAFSHDAELTDFVKTMPVNKVKVIIAGEVSKEARARLEKEVHGPVEVHGIDWLITSFTDFYPQVFFEGKITTFLQRKVQELETKHRVIRSKKILSECFVEPVVRATDVNLDFGEELRAIINRKELPFSRLKSLLSTHRRIILVGDPGTGKSAALAKLTIDLLKSVYLAAIKTGKRNEKTTIPILVTARELLGIENVRNLLQSYLGEAEIIDRVIVKVLMIDGLDEVAANKRGGVIEKAKAFADELVSALLIASRKVDLLSITPSGFEKYELLPFGAGRALQLIEKIHSSSDVLGTLRDGLDKIRYQIPMVPLSLILLIEIVEEQKEIPASVTELYDRYNDSVLGRFDKEKGIEVLFEYLIKKRFLAQLAYSAFSTNGLVEITRDDFDSFCRDYAEEYGLENEIDKFVREIERAGVLEITEETVLFTHRSFLDYFSAFYIFDRRDEFDELNEFLTKIYFNDLWGETTFFYVGQKREISEKLLSRILDYNENSLWVNSSKMMAGRLLQAGWHSPTKTKYRGIEKALSYLPPVRESLYRIAEEGRWPEPKIMVDLVLLTAANYSLRSGFLATDLKKLFADMSTRDKITNLSSLIVLLEVMRPFTDPEEFRKEVEDILTLISERDEIEPEEKLRATLLLTVIKGRDKVLTKTLNKKLTRLREQFPKVFKNLLPPPPTKKQQFRPPSRKK